MIGEASEEEIANASYYPHFRQLTSILKAKNETLLCYYLNKMQTYFIGLSNQQDMNELSNYFHLCIAYGYNDEVMKRLLQSLPKDLFNDRLEGVVLDTLSFYSFETSRKGKPPKMRYLLLFLKQFTFSSDFFERLVIAIAEAKLPEAFSSDINAYLDIYWQTLRVAQQHIGDLAFELMHETHFDGKSPAQTMAMARKALFSENDQSKGTAFLCMLVCMPESKKADYLNKMAENANIKRDAIYQNAIELWSLGPTDILGMPLSNKAKEAILSSMI